MLCSAPENFRYSSSFVKFDFIVTYCYRNVENQKRRGPLCSNRVQLKSRRQALEAHKQENSQEANAETSYYLPERRKAVGNQKKKKKNSYDH